MELLLRWAPHLLPPNSNSTMRLSSSTVFDQVLRNPKEFLSHFVTEMHCYTSTPESYHRLSREGQNGQMALLC